MNGQIFNIGGGIKNSLSILELIEYIKNLKDIKDVNYIHKERRKVIKIFLCGYK